MLLERFLKSGENLTVKFKSERKRPLRDEEIVENVVCLANRSGGYLIIGVEDDGRITGAKPYPRNSKDLDPNLLRAMIYAKTRPHLWVDVWVEEVLGKKVVIVRVPSNPIVSTSSGRYLIRGIGGDGKPACFPLEPHEILSIMSSNRNYDFTAEVLEMGEEILDEESVELVVKLVRRSGDPELTRLPKNEILRIIGALTIDGKVTLAGLLLCGKESIIKSFVPFHEVIVNHFSGSMLRSQRLYTNSLLKIFYDLMKDFENRKKGIGEIIKKGIRYEIPNIDEEVYREVIANALIHRDYSQPGNVIVEWYDEGRLRVTNPGGFVKGVSVENILSSPPSPRNPLLSEMFRRMGIVERTGRGIDKIYTGQAMYGKPLPIWNVTDRSVSITLILNEWDARISETLIGEDLTPEEILLMYEIMGKESISLEEGAKVIQRSRDETLFFIKSLENKGFVVRRNGYVLSKTSELEIDRESAVIEFIRRNGKIKRADVVRLFGVSEVTASRLLSSMVKKGLLRKNGKGPSVFYTLK